MTGLCYYVMVAGRVQATPRPTWDEARRAGGTLVPSAAPMTTAHSNIMAKALLEDPAISITNGTASTA